MKQLHKCMIVFSVLFLFTSCATTGFRSKSGPGWVTYVTDAGFATSKSKVTKTGVACAHNFLGLAAVGDNSITAAKNNGKITKISHIDYEYLNILFWYGKVCTHVHGT